ncbi:MAG: hypothetical protein U5N26_02530 [Candidatus Marinimicrobia bacterium]|nr:hypothetical protein [Candidatus Neomarinimicrobiota bacterium]
MERTKRLQEKLYKEMVARIKQVRHLGSLKPEARIPVLSPL